jgi:hypothetical protein
MPIDLGSLKKLESLPASASLDAADEHALVLVLVKLRQGASCPDYVVLRGGISACVFSAEIEVGQLLRLEADETVESVSVARVLPRMR